ncbi:MAG: methionyl-tRNA formyltransferase [Rhodospirillales bacterium]
MTGLRLVFLGSPDFSVPVLDALLAAGHEIACVYAQPPRPAGRGHQIRPCPVHARAEELGIEVRTPETFREGTIIEDFRSLGADAAVVVAYGLILPQAALEAPRLGCINVHASLLPRWRGAAPIQRAIEAGDGETGVCIMAMEAGLDTGPVYLRRTCRITESMTGGELHDRLAALGGAAIVEALPGIADGSLAAEPQASEGVTYAAKIGPRDGDIDWSGDAAAIERRVRAFNPWPGSAFRFGDDRIKVFSAGAILTGHGAVPGTVLDTTVEGCPLVACGDGALVLRELQRPGKGRQPADAFLRGYPLPAGTVLE